MTVIPVHNGNKTRPQVSVLPLINTNTIEEENSRLKNVSFHTSQCVNWYIYTPSWANCLCEVFVVVVFPVQEMHVVYETI